MAISQFPSTTETIDLAEFRGRVLAKVDPDHPETLLQVSHDIVALANDPNLLTDRILADLEDGQMGQSCMYSPQSCLLDTFGQFTVRINLWKAAGLSSAEQDYFSYFLYHNHDFAFLTTNYYGPGYATSIYEADEDWERLGPGDPVSMRFLERTTLPPGKVMYYRKGMDLHSQIPPPQDSASLNLLIDNRMGADRTQFYFDVATARIVGRVENMLARRLTALDFGRFLASPQSMPVLNAIAATSPCRATRDKARQWAATVLEETTDSPGSVR
jgi:hypothetical protein